MLKNLLEYSKCVFVDLRNGEKPFTYTEWKDYVDYMEWAEEPENSQGWICQCGHWDESGLHCERCGCEPPWGCDCCFCNEQEDYDEYCCEWEHYPGDLLADDLNF